MDYAIRTLEDEKAMIERCLTNWDKKHYPEAYKDRNAKIKDLQKAIQTLKNSEL